MRLLLDTQVWLWMVSAADDLSDDLKAHLTDEATDVFLSAAAVWEIGMKVAAGKLKLTGQPGVLVPMYIKRSGVQPLSVTVDHALAAAALPDHHRDPFDRVMLAQAQIEELTFVTADPQLAEYDVPMLQASN